LGGDRQIAALFLSAHILPRDVQVMMTQAGFIRSSLSGPMSDEPMTYGA
jgi:hypothetical protein